MRGTVAMVPRILPSNLLALDLGQVVPGRVEVQGEEPEADADPIEAAELDLAEYSGIACISGDGLVHEVYNGLYARSDWDEKASRCVIRFAREVMHI